MNIEEIRQLAADLTRSGLSGVEIERPGLRLSLKRGAARQVPLPAEAAAETACDTLDIKSIGVGRFLDAHPDNGIALAPPGSAVQVGQVVALLAVGNLLLPVRSPHTGQVLQLLADVGSTVSYGQPLISLSPCDTEAEQP